MKVELKNLLEFIHNPPLALIEVYKEDGLSDTQILKMLAYTEIIVTSFFALTKNRMLRATGKKVYPKNGFRVPFKFTVVQGGKL